MDIEPGWTRRELLVRAAWAWPLFHVGGLTAAATARESPAPSAEFHTISLPTSDVAGQRRFYGEVLEFPILAEDAASVTVGAGRTQMRFFLDRSVGKPLYHFAFNIPTNKIEACMRWMDGRAALLPHRETGNTLVHFTSIDAHSIYFFDPSGNLVEFIARHELDNARPGAFSLDDVLNTSEIGLVVDDVQATADELGATLGLGAYGGGRSPAFRAIGAAHGVFIVVRKGRNWLMTDVAATPEPVEVRLRGTGPPRLELKTGPCRILRA